MPDESTSGRAGASTEKTAKAVREEFRADFERALVKDAAECFERGDVARGDISFAAGQWLPFEQLPRDIQRVVVESAQWLRTNLIEALDDWRTTFPKWFRRLARNLCDIYPDMAWIGAQLNAVRTAMEGENQVWLMIATDGTQGGKTFVAHGEWLAPGWLEGWPGVASRADLLMATNLSKEQTDEVFRAFGERVGKSFTLAQESARNRAQILIAKREVRTPNRRAPSVKSGARLKNWKKRRTDEFNQRIAERMVKFPKMNHRDILAKIDREYEQRPSEIPKRFKKHGHRRRGMVMVGAFDCRECRHSVENFMSAMRKPLRLGKAPKSRRPR